MALPVILQAVQNGDIATVIMLLDAGYDPNIPVGDDGDLLLCWAAAYGHNDIVELLLERGADVDAVPAHAMGGPALSEAVFEGHFETAKLLAAAGAEVDYEHAAALGMLERLEAYDEDEAERWAAFLAACKTGQLEVVKYLVGCGIDVTIYPPGGDYGGIGASGLHWAATGCHEELVRWLVQVGTPVDIVDDTFDNTPLGWVQLDDKRAIAEVLMELGADPALAQR